MQTVLITLHRTLLAMLAIASLSLSVQRPARAADPALTILSAENFYAEAASRVGGRWVHVDAVLNNPESDPHLFEASPSVARRVADADIIIYSGLGYDGWMPRLLSNARGQADIVDVAKLTQRKPGSNPHIWYDPKTLPTLAKRLTALFSRRDPTHAAGYRKNLKAYLASFAPLKAAIAQTRARFARTAITATEPVFGLMAAALSLKMRNTAFQQAVMNDTEPAASRIAAFETDLREHRVNALIYNRQVTSPLTSRLRRIAAGAGVPAVAVTETMPPGKSFVTWMTEEVNALANALATAPKAMDDQSS